MPANSSRGGSRRLFIVGGYGGLAALFLAICVAPYVRSARTLNAQIVRSRQQIDQRLAAESELQKVHRQVELIDLEVRNHDRLLPINQDLGPFMEQLSHELDHAGMKEITVRALPPITLGRSQQLPIEIGGTCTFRQFDAFLVRLEALPRMSSVSHLSIEADSAMTGKVSIQLTLSIYNAKPSQ